MLLPNMDQWLMDDTQDPTKINDQIDRNKTASNWTNMKEMEAVHRHTPGASLDLTAQMRHSHREIAMKEAMGAVMPIPELTNEETDRSLIQTKPQPEIRILDNNWLGLEIGGTRGGDTIRKHGQGIAVMIAEMHASSYNGTKSKKYHGLLIYNEESFGTDVDEEPLLSWIVAATQQTAARRVRGTVGLRG